MKHSSFHSRLSAILGVLMAVALIGTTSACSFFSHSNPEASPTTTAATGPITVTSSLNQWGSLASQIGGDDVKVTSILSSTTTDAHDFEPTTQDIKKLHDAEVVVTNGAGYDTWASKNLPTSVQNISVGQIVGATDGDNPHLWFSRDARFAVAKELAETFTRLRPDHKAQFTKNLQQWEQTENKLEERIHAFGNSHPNLTYAASEDIATYLMSDMKFEDMTPTGYRQAIASESEPSPSDVRAMEQLLTDKQVSLFINNAQESTDLSKQLLQDANTAGIPVQEVTEQMPKEYDTLTAWIDGLFTSIAHHIDSEYDTTAADASPSASASTSSTTK